MKKVVEIILVLLLIACFFSCATKSTGTDKAITEEKLQTEENIPEVGPETDSISPAKKLPATEMIAPTDNPEAELAYNSGSILINEARYAEAEPYLRKAISLDPEFVDAYDHLGLVLRHLGRAEEAVDVLKQSLSIEPVNAVAYSNLFLVYMDLSLYDLAYNTCVEAINYVPDDPEGYYNAGSLMYSFGYYSEATTFMGYAAKLYMLQESDLIYDATYYLGLAYFELEDWENAEMYCGYTLQAFPEDQSLQQYYLQAAKNAGHLQ